MNDDEKVVKLLNHEAFKNGAIDDAAFQKRELCRPKKRPINNLPGSRDGESLIRSDGNDIVELAKRPQATEGVAIAEVTAIRSIVATHDPQIRLFRIYEDPVFPELPAHAVIRFDDSDDEKKAQFTIARKALIKLFTKVA